MENLYNYEDRLVRFAGEIIPFSELLARSFAGPYYCSQLIRSSGSAALNYGEAQATITPRDFVHKVSLTAKELKESKTTLKILDYAKMGAPEKRKWLLEECQELIAIASKMILNKRQSNS